MSWTVKRETVLTREEIVSVLDDLRRLARRSVNSQMNLIIFRLATCCGLRVSELGRLTLDNVRVASLRPKVIVPDTIAKYGKARVVPIIDQGTLDDLRAWKHFRENEGAGPNDLVICTRVRGFGRQIDRFTVRERFKTACRVLGPERRREITIHHGRHSFISHALHKGYNIVQVMEMAGHSSLATTSIYAHLVSDEAQIGDLFA